eukprot:3674036-Pyramimonas_sp.AAC.1
MPSCWAASRCDVAVALPLKFVDCEALRPACDHQRGHIALAVLEHDFRHVRGIIVSPPRGCGGPYSYRPTDYSRGVDLRNPK